MACCMWRTPVTQLDAQRQSEWQLWPSVKQALQAPRSTFMPISRLRIRRPLLGSLTKSADLPEVQTGTYVPRSQDPDSNSFLTPLRINNFHPSFAHHYAITADGMQH
jgi:hypothetical protein